MTIIQKINIFFKKKINFLSSTSSKSIGIQKKSVIFGSFLMFFSIIFFFSMNYITSKNDKNSNNLKEITKTSEFSNLTSFLISKINSPYQEINYIINNNDTIEKILKKFKVRNDDIREISIQLKQKKLANIYSGRKLSLILKKLENGTNSIVNFVYPINNTTSVEIRKSEDKFLVKENIL